MVCAYSNAHIFDNGTVTITEYGDDDAAKCVDETIKDVIFKNCALFRKWINNKKRADR